MSSVILKVTPTCYGTAWRNDNDFGLDHSPLSNTTLNEKFGIHNTTNVPPGTRMSIGYYCIGNGALRSGPDASDGSVSYAAVPHRAINAALYNLTPFVLKHHTEDLSVAERAKYAMRVPLVINGEIYWGYYLKAIVIGNTENIINEITVENGLVTNTSPFTPNTSNLSPSKPSFSLNQAIPSQEDYYQVFKPIDMSFTEDDVQRYSEAIDILYDDVTGKGLVSELGIVAGYKSTVPLLDENKAPISGNYTECLRSIVTDIINLNPTNFYAATEGLDIIIDLGGTLPKLEMAQ